MKIWIAALALAFAGVAPAMMAPAAAGTELAQAKARTGKAGRNLQWPKAPGNARYRVGNIRLTMENRVSGTDSELLDRVLTVHAPGFPAFTIDSGEDDSYEPSVMVVQTPSRTPMILFQTFSGGAHCCTTRTAIVPRGARLAPVVVYHGDGGPSEEAPRDLDRDGALDFVGYDNAFLYSFSSYAGSFAPPTVVNIVNGEAVDVSAKPGFRSLFEETAREAAKACADRENDDRNGACATLVAASARLGRFEQGWAEAVRNHARQPSLPWPTGCRVAEGEQGCPDDQVITHPDFPTALRIFLAEQGYIRS